MKLFHISCCIPLWHGASILLLRTRLVFLFRINGLIVLSDNKFILKKDKLVVDFENRMRRIAHLSLVKTLFNNLQQCAES